MAKWGSPSRSSSHSLPGVATTMGGFLASSLRYSAAPAYLLFGSRDVKVLAGIAWGSTV